MSTRQLLRAVALAALALTACDLFSSSKPKGPRAPKPIKIKAFTETRGVTSLAPVEGALWVATNRGLIRWEIDGRGHTLLTQKEGLPSDRISAVAPDHAGGVWVMTAGGLAHELKGGWQNYPAVPVGDFVTGLLPTKDGLWAGGPDGLARLSLSDGKWTRYLGSASITALAMHNGELFAGTGGRGVVRVLGDRSVVYGPEQGCDIEVVRGLVSSALGLVAIGDAPGGGPEAARLAIWDGKRFWSYRVTGPSGQVLEWLRRIGDETLVGSGARVFALRRAVDKPAKEPFALKAMEVKGQRQMPTIGLASAEIPAAGSPPPPNVPAPPPPVVDKPPETPPPADKTVKEEGGKVEEKAEPKGKKGKKKGKKGEEKKGEEKKAEEKKAEEKKADDKAKPDEKKADDKAKPDEKKADDKAKPDEKKAEPAAKPEARKTAKGPDVQADEDEGGPAKPATTPATAPAPTPAPAPPVAPTPPPPAVAGPHPVEVQVRAEEEAKTTATTGPALELLPWGSELPDGVTAIGPDGPTLYVGTRFLGALKVGREPISYRTSDLAQGAIRLTVACESNNDCYVATGGPRAWRFDGQSFEPANIDPEPGSHILAVVEMPGGGVLAIHRGEKDPGLRMSSSAKGNWTPIGLQEVHVPEGVPEISFATYSPAKHLWLGLHYRDQVNDAVDYGAAEVFEEKVIYHRRFTAGGKAENIGIQLPNDLKVIFFRENREVWFGTNAGVVRLTGQEFKLFTENDGLEAEHIYDILEGPDSQIWVATARGIGKYDGQRWTFPQPEDILRVRASSLARDQHGFVFIGHDAGLLVLGATTAEKIDSSRGLLDDRIQNLVVDHSDRVWILTEKGLSIIAR